MILKQYYLGCLAHASYLVGDEKSGNAVVVDPQRDVEQYLKDAKESGLRIRDVVLTHFHADFVAGHLELAERAGATICLGARASAEYPFVALHDGDVRDLGPDVRLGVLETPGHTPEAICLLVYDRASNAEAPHAVLTGDTLFIGDVGRPDLMASIGITADELAGMLYDSLRDKLLTLPDETLVYPAHGAGSMCGKNLSQDTVSTIGVQRRYNYALAPMERSAFVALVTADQPEAPAYFAYDAHLNRSARPTLDASLARSLRGLTLDELLALARSGAQVLDVRDPAEYAGAHVKGSLNVGLSGKFATWAGTLLDRERPIVLVAEPGREREAALRLGRVGFDRVEGYLEGGMGAAADRPDVVARTDRITAPALAELLEEPGAHPVLDVRTPSERATASIPGSVHIPLNQLARRMAEVPRGGRLVVHCQSGYRSSIAASMLEGEGITDVLDLVGGMSAYTPEAKSCS